MAENVDLAALHHKIQRIQSLLQGVKALTALMATPGNYMTTNWSNALLHVFDEWLPGKVEQRLSWKPCIDSGETVGMQEC